MVSLNVCVTEQQMIVTNRLYVHATWSHGKTVQVFYNQSFAKFSLRYTTRSLCWESNCKERFELEVGIRDPYFAIFVTPLREHLVDKRHILSYISEFVCQTEKKKEREDS